MWARRSQALQITIGFTAAVLVNLLFLAALLLEKVTTKWSVPTGGAPAVQLLLQRLPLAAPSMPRIAGPSTTAPHRLSSQSTKSGRLPAEPSQSRAPPRFTPLPSPASANSTPPLATEDELQGRTASALRHLGACSDFAFQSRSDAHCGKSWGDADADVEALESAARAAFSAQADSLNARLQRSSAVRAALGDHSGEGSNLHYGCTLKHGKMQCSTY